MLSYTVTHKIEGDTVHFHAHPEGDPGPFSRPDFEIRFGCSLEKVSISAMFSGFLALFASALPQDQLVTLQLPKGVDPIVAWLWTRFHQKPRVEVTIGGTAIDLRSYDESQGRTPYTARADDALEGGKLLLLFGGGKDCSLALESFLPVLGPDRIHLLLMTYQRAKMLRHERRHVVQSLAPASEAMGVDYSCVRTTFWRALAERKSFDPGNALYYAVALVAAESLGCRGVAYSLEYTHYYTRILNSDSQSFHFGATRPEFNRLLSAAMSEFLGHPFVIFNANRHVTERHPMAELKRRNSKLLPSVMMCENTLVSAERFCLRCTKCFEFSLNAIANDISAPEFDFDFFFGESLFAARAREAAEVWDLGPAWNPVFGAPIHLATNRDLLHCIGVNPSRVTSKAAKDTFRIIHERIGRRGYPSSLALWRDGIDEEDYPAREAIWSDIAPHYKVARGVIEPFPAGSVDTAIEPWVEIDILAAFEEQALG